MISPEPIRPSPLSFTIAVFISSSDGLGSVVTVVGSLVGSPSVSASVGNPSSDTSDTSFVFPGLLATTLTVLDVPPALTACWLIVKVAVYVNFSPVRKLDRLCPVKFELTKTGSSSNDKRSPLKSVNVSTNVSSDRLVLPVFSTVMVYVIVSPIPFLLSPLLSITSAVLITSILGI